MRRILLLLSFLLVTPATAQIVNTLPFQLQNGTTADATQVMADFNQIVNNVNSNAAKNGSNSDITALLGLTTPVNPASGGSTVYVGGTSGGTANAQTAATVVPTGFTLAAGKRVIFLAGTTNTGATTLNVASSGATNVFKLTPSGSSALTGGEIVSGSIVEAVYDGTQYQLITNNLSVLGPLTNLSSAAPDLGTIPSHNISVTGTTTITAFGSTASTNYPVYYLTFAGALTLTYNATSLILPGTADITTATNDTAIAQYLGSGNWQVLFYQRATGANIVATTPLCGATALSIKNNAGTPNTSIDWSATQVVMQTSGGVSITANSPSGTINATNVGVINGTQVALANSTWYNVYFLSNGNTTGGFIVPSGTGLSAPSGYTYSCRLGAMRTDGSAHFRVTLQLGRTVQYGAVQLAGSAPAGICTSGAFTAVATGSFVPPTASKISVSVMTGYNGGSQPYACFSPNATGGSTSSSTQPPPLIIGSAGAIAAAYGTFVLETSNVYYAGGAGAALFVIGWEDAVNAN